MKTHNRKALKLDFEEVSTLFLSYPEEVIECGKDYTSAKPVFDRIIRAIPSSLNLVVLCKTARIASNIEKMRRKRTTTLVNSELSSIWLRDSIGWSMTSSLIKPIFKPKYYRKYFDEAEIINNYCKVVHSILGVDMELLPIIWDGGNLVTNGEVGFITEQILEDNKKTHSEKEIKELIKTTLGIDPVFIPVHPADPFGHADGVINFLNKDTLAIASYPKTWRKKELAYIRDLKTKVKRYVGNVVDIKENPIEGANSDDVAVKGCYVNFLKLGKIILVPSYQDKETEKYNYELLKPYGKVVYIPAIELAKFGGLFHCISFTN